MRISDLANEMPLFYRSSDSIWTDPWIARRMLDVHLDTSSDAASRAPATIDRTVDWIAAHLPPRARVLDLGCGPGLYAERLTRRGFQVTGLDFNAVALEYAVASAAKEGLSIDYRLGSYLEADLGGPYDAAICVYCDFGALTDDERVVLLGRIRAALAPDGLFVFDVFGPGLEASKSTGKSWRAGTGGDFWSPSPYLLLEERVRFPEVRTFGTRYLLMDAPIDGATAAAQVKEFALWDRCFTEEDITTLLGANGFAVEKIAADLIPRNDFTSDDVLFAVARKTEA